jgi:hypothetical protein
VLASYIYNWSPEECQASDFECPDGYKTEGYEATMNPTMSGMGFVLLADWLERAAPGNDKDLDPTASPDAAKRHN